MKNLITYQTQTETKPKIKAGPEPRAAARTNSRFAPRPAYLDTDPVYAEIDRMNGVIRDDDASDIDVVLKLVTAYHRLMRFLFQVVAYNRIVKQKWDMLTHPAWRLRVLQDLGGEPALRRWEARKARSLEPREDRMSPHEPVPHSSGERRAPRFKTDRDGLFRLAPVTRQRDPVSLPNPGLSPGIGGTPYQDPSEKPIPLTPDELRGRRIEPIGTHDTGLETVTTRLSTAMSRMPGLAQLHPLQMVEQVFAGMVETYYENPV